MRVTKQQLGYSSPIVFVILIPILVMIAIFTKSYYLLSIATMIGIYSIVTFGLTLLMGYAGQVSIGQAAFFGVGAYTSGVLTVKHGFDPWIAMLLGIVLSGLIAYIVGIPTLKLREHFLALATIGFNVIVYIILIGVYDITGGASGLSGIPKLSIFGFVLNKDLHYFILVWIVVLIVGIISLNIVNSHIGRVLQGIHDSEIATLSVGVNIASVKLQIFVLSSVFASVAGSLYAHYLSFIAPPTFFITASISFMVMMAVGGSRPIWGSILGAAIMTTLGEALRYFISTYYRSGGQVEIIAYGLILMLVMIFFPKGLAPLLAKLGTSGKRLAKMQQKEIQQ